MRKSKSRKQEKVKKAKEARRIREEGKVEHKRKAKWNSELERRGAEAVIGFVQTCLFEVDLERWEAENAASALATEEQSAA